MAANTGYNSSRELGDMPPSELVVTPRGYDLTPMIDQNAMRAKMVAML